MKMASKTYPAARLLPSGELVSFEEGIPLPNYTGPVYADFGGRRYVLWAFPLDGELPWERRWEVINPGCEIVESALAKFIKEHSS